MALAQQTFGETTVVNADHLDSHYAGNVDVPEGAVYKDTLNYTWNKLTTREDAYNQGLKVTLGEWGKLGAGTSTAGGGAGISSEQEFHADFTQKYGAQQSESTTFTREVELNEPGVYSITFTRKSGDAEQRVTTKGDFDFSLLFVDETQVDNGSLNIFELLFTQKKPPTKNRFQFGWGNAKALLAVMRREAPSNYDMYTEYMEYPEDAGYVNAIDTPHGEASFLMQFKDSIVYDVIIRRAIRATKLTPAKQRG